MPMTIATIKRIIGLIKDNPAKTAKGRSGLLGILLILEKG